MGPIAILDKSAFQSLSAAEHSLFQMWFMENITPILVFEIQGDLAKEAQTGKTPREKVRELARKFHGSGGIVHRDYLNLVLHSLLGDHVPLTGQIVPHDHSIFTDPDSGLRGMAVGLSPLNEAIMRWSRGEVSAAEEVNAKIWRSVTKSFDLSSLLDQLSSRSIVLPKPESRSVIVEVADSLLRERALRSVWIGWLGEQLRLPPGTINYINRRLSRDTLLTLRTYAPYAHHCLRSLLSLLIAVRHAYLKKEATHLLDLQYLYYLPFCQVFVSDDIVHRTLAPGLMRRNQVFVRGVDLKADLKRILQEREMLPEDSPERLSYKFGSVPPQPEDSIIQELHRRCMHPGGFGADS